VCLGLSKRIKCSLPWPGGDVYLPESPTKCLVFLPLGESSPPTRRHARHLWLFWGELSSRAAKIIRHGHGCCCWWSVCSAQFGSVWEKRSEIQEVSAGRGVRHSNADAVLYILFIYRKIEHLCVPKRECECECVRVSGGFQIGIGRGIRVYPLHQHSFK